MWVNDKFVVYQLDRQSKEFISTLFRVWQADGRGELVRACRPQPSMLLDRRIWKQPHQQCKFTLYLKNDDIIANLHLKNGLQSVLSFSFDLHVYANSNSFFNKHFNESYWLNIIKMFSWNVSGNPMEQYFTEWESGYPKNRCPASPPLLLWEISSKRTLPAFYRFFCLFGSVFVHRTCELWVLQCSR